MLGKVDNSSYCKNVVSAESVNLFYNNARIIVAGNSFSGKTFFSLKLLKKYISIFDRIILADCPNNVEFTNDEILNKKIEIYNYIPSINELSMTYPDSHIIVVLDDNYNESFNFKEAMEIFVRGRHKNISTLLITQNLLSKARYQRDISLNATHFILFKIRDLSQIQILARQIYGKDYSKSLLDVYKYIQKNQKFGHLLIDLSSNAIPSTELRSNIVAEEGDGINSFELCYKILN